MLNRELNAWLNKAGREPLKGWVYPTGGPLTSYKPSFTAPSGHSEEFIRGLPSGCDTFHILAFPLKILCEGPQRQIVHPTRPNRTYRQTTTPESVNMGKVHGSLARAGE